MAASLGVKWQSWSELAVYRGGHAWLNDGQQFAIIYPERVVVAGSEGARAENITNVEGLGTCGIKRAESEKAVFNRARS